MSARFKHYIANVFKTHYAVAILSFVLASLFMVFLVPYLLLPFPLLQVIIKFPHELYESDD